MGQHPHNKRALRIGHKYFDVKAISEVPRQEKQISTSAENYLRHHYVDFIFNFLSPVILTPLQLSHSDVAINFHPAPPEYPGVGGASYALFNGDETYGVTAHVMKEKVDTGCILKVRRFPFFSDESCESLFDKSLDESLFLFGEVLKDLHEGVHPTCDEEWKRKPISRKEFEEWMDVKNDSHEVIQKKINALRHSKHSWPYVKNYKKVLVSI